MAINQTPYQRRMTKIVWTGSIYGIVTPIILSWNNVASSTNLMVYSSTLFVFFCLAIGFDAIYDSLSEKLPPIRNTES